MSTTWLKTAPLTDEDLLKMFADETLRKQAFTQIAERYSQKLYWHIRKIVISHDDTDDVLQNTLIKVWTGLVNFRSDSKLFTWLYRIATNESISFLNSKRSKNFTPFESVENELENTLESDEYFNGNEIEKKLQKALLTLPEKQRIVFNLKYFEEMKYEDMSEVLETSVGALKASYHHAVKKIEAFFEEN